MTDRRFGDGSGNERGKGAQETLLEEGAVSRGAARPVQLVIYEEAMKLERVRCKRKRIYEV